jgi:diacylglycerol kinase
MKLFRAFIYAGNGIGYCFKQELNFRIHLLVTIAVVVTGIFFSISTTEWLFVTSCCSLVLSLELLNTALEKICDAVTKDINPLIKIIKDTAAGAVFVSAMGSAVMGIIIFLPKTIHLIKLLV